MFRRSWPTRFALPAMAPVCFSPTAYDPGFS